MDLGNNLLAVILQMQEKLRLLEGGFGSFMHRNDPHSLKFCSVGAVQRLAKICSVSELKHLVWKVLLCSNSGADK